MSGISKMDLRALRYFVHVAEARSFSKAAVQLRIAQPALSRQIRKLEDEVGLALILRTRRQLELTDAGLLLLQRAHSLLRQAAQTADDVRAHGSRVRHRRSARPNAAANAPAAATEARHRSVRA